MLNRYTLLLAGALVCASLSAQKRTLIDFPLRAYLDHADPTSMVDLFLQGSTGEVGRAVRAHGGFVKMSMRNWTSMRMPAGRVAELDGEPAVRSIEYSLGHPRTMNDSMRVKTHIDWVQQGLAPLPHGYSGDGVIVGIVDTGIDFNHPDFNDDNGSRVLYLWDHNFPFSGQNTPAPYNYGQEWDKSDIDSGNCPSIDLDPGGHGTTVAGTAAGNGGLTGHYIGAAPKSGLIFVVSDLTDNFNWASTVVDGVKYIFDHAAALGRPAVVNLSIGDYLGSHDGFDPAALLIDSMLMAAPGRAVVCAAGNSACFPNYQLRMNVTSDTTFSWIKTNLNSPFLNVDAYIDFWADTAQMNNVWYSIGADKVTGGYSFRGRVPFRNVQGTIGTVVTDTLLNIQGQRICAVSTIAAIRGGQYHLEIGIFADSTQYNWRVTMTGNGRADAWDNSGFGLSDIISTNLPTVAQFPDIANYVLPTLDRGIVDAWACSPHVITVANYNNELSYPACDGTTQTLGGVEGAIATCTSYGLTRTDQQKPDLAAPGDLTFSAAPLSLINLFQNGPGIFKLSADCMHVRSGGTSIASPAVAGAVALYLEKCPFAPHDQIKQAFIDAAFADAFTGAVPNARWGYGKVDAFTPMVAADFSVTASGDVTPFCEGDSALAQGPPGFADYFWSDGTTGPEAWSHGGPLALTVINDQGCKAGTDTLFFTTLPLPAVPQVSQNGHLLTSTAANSYQWFLDGTAITNATAQTFNATDDGAYTVMITDANGCSSMSDPLSVSFMGIAENGTVDFQIWPVPSSDALYVTNNESGPVRYEILDATGKCVKRGQLRAAGTSRLDVDRLAPGPYSLRTSLNERSGQRMFVVQ